MSNSQQTFEALQMPAVEEREKIDAFWFRFQFLGVGQDKNAIGTQEWNVNKPWRSPPVFNRVFWKKESIYDINFISSIWFLVKVDLIVFQMARFFFPHRPGRKNPQVGKRLWPRSGWRRTFSYPLPRFQGGNKETKDRGVEHFVPWFHIHIFMILWSFYVFLLLGG